MLWEIVAVAVVASWFPVRLATWIVLGVGVAVIAVTSVRFDGLCGYEWVLAYSRYRRRRAGEQSGPDPLRAAVPGLRITQHIDRAGNRAGVAELDGSWISVVRVAPPMPVNPRPLLPLLRKAYDRTDIRLHTAQLVTWSVPSPPRARYYGDQRDTAPLQMHWLVLRYRPAEAPGAALARGGGENGARRAAASAAIALVSEIAGLGLPSVALDATELRQDLLVSLGAGTAGGAVKVKETWQDWSIGTLRQLCFRARDGQGELAVLGRWATGSAFTATSYTLTRDQRGRVRGSGLVRVGIHPTEARMTTRQLVRLLGLPLLPHNGRHGPAVRATLPLAQER